MKRSSSNLPTPAAAHLETAGHHQFQLWLNKRNPVHLCSRGRQHRLDVTTHTAEYRRDDSKLVFNPTQSLSPAASPPLTHFYFKVF